jgi:adenylate kinase family enzyme
VQRVAVVGNSGSGKTTVGRQLADRLQVPFVELDAVFHQAGWRALPLDEFRHTVADLVTADGWVVDGSYSAVRDLVWSRADTVVWFDLPRRTVMWQIVRRTLTRMITRQELWNGNRERLGNLFRLDPEQSVIRWAWTHHARSHTTFTAAAADPALVHLEFVRVGNRADARRLLERALG